MEHVRLSFTQSETALSLRLYEQTIDLLFEPMQQTLVVLDIPRNMLI